MAWLMFKAALYANSDQAGGTEKAFVFLQNTMGTVVLLLVALGLAAYGTFQLVCSKYLDLES